MAVGMTFSTFTHFCNENQQLFQNTLLVLDVLQKTHTIRYPTQHGISKKSMQFNVYLFSNAF